MPRAFARRIYRCRSRFESRLGRALNLARSSASRGSKIRRDRHDGQSRYSCYRRSYLPAGVRGGTRRPLGRQGHFFVGAVCFFEGSLASDPRRSTGSCALQPRVESGTPPLPSAACAREDEIGNDRRLVTMRRQRTGPRNQPAAPRNASEASARAARGVGLKAVRAKSASAPSSRCLGRGGARRIFLAGTQAVPRVR